MLSLSITSFIISAVLLIISGIFLVKSLDKIAKFLHISEFSAAFLIIAFATSLPELTVGIFSAINGNPELSLGNLLGSNLIDITLLIGIFVLIGKEIDFKKEKIEWDLWTMIIGILAMLILGIIGSKFSRIDGIILISLYLVSLKGVFNGRKRVSKKNNKKEPVTLTIIIFILSLIGVFIAANLIISSGTKIAEDFGIAKMAVGIILIASATTLPELVFGVSATEMKHSRMAIGDQIGAIIIHAGLILGIVALIHPIPVQLSTFLLPMLFVIVSAAFLAFCIHFRRKLSRIEGILLILIYLIFMLTQILKNNNFY